MKFQLKIKADVLSRHAEVTYKLSYQNLPSHATWSRCLKTFLPFFLLPLQSLSKLLTPTRILRNFPIFLFYPILTRPRLDNFQFERALWVINPSILYSQLLQAGSTLIVLRSSMCWIRQQLDKWSVVEPTWLPSSNREASLRGYERLKDQRQESGWK